jgi:hypothetical protein
MTMRCILCTRPLQSAAVYIGAYPVGPTCARRAGLVKIASRGTNKALTLGPATRVRRGADDAQMALELEAA